MALTDPKSQKDVDIKKHELEERIKSLGGVVAPSPLTSGFSHLFLI